MNVTLLSVGDELLVGQVVNTNAAWLGDYLAGLGMIPTRTVVVGDSVDRMTDELKAAFTSSDVVIVTGGLGPTHDDVTRDAVAGFFGVELQLQERWFQLIARRFERRGMSVPERNRIQAMIPQGMEVLPNADGTAPGFWKSWETATGPKALAVLPGVPEEMKIMMREQVAPRLAPLSKKPVHQITIRTTGIGESHLQELLEPVLGRLPDAVSVAYLPSPFGVRLRITERALEGETGQLAERLAAEITRLASVYVYGRGDDTLEKVVGDLLKARGETVAVAESCTGGAVGSLLTDVPGASAYVLGGVIAYCNSVKEDLLSVDEEVLLRQGAVSESVAVRMAEHVRDRTGASYGLSTTGILGPTGGTREKPVGTIWIACAGGGETVTMRLRLGKERLKNKQRVVAATLDLLRRRLVEGSVGDG